MRAAAVIILLAPAFALADAHHVLVLRSEGGGDAALHAKIDAEVVKLAKNLGGNVEAGDITLSDAAAATGCTMSDGTCKDEVLATLGADELVATTIAVGPVETKVTVRRMAKGGAPQSATATIASDEPLDQKLAAEVGPMFGVKPPPVHEAPKPPPTPEPKPVPPAHEVAPPQTQTVTAAPNNTVPAAEPTEHDNRNLELAGIIGGGVLVATGIVLWVEASSTQNDINAAPTRTVADFQNLQNLEANGDAYALAGNIAFFGGVAIAAVSSYFFARDHVRAERRAAARTDHRPTIAPVVMGHGAGVTLTFGGTR